MKTLYVGKWNDGYIDLITDEKVEDKDILKLIPKDSVGGMIKGGNFIPLSEEVLFKIWEGGC